MRKMRQIKIDSNGQTCIRILSEDLIEQGREKLQEAIDESIGELPLEEIKAMTDQGLVTIDEVVEWFGEKLKHSLRVVI